MITSRPWSCDSMVALPDSTTSGAVLFGKNSDRPAGEAQPLRRRAARKAGEALRLANVVLEDADAFAHVGSAPYWCWGYEIGVNEHRVAIGNEAVFTRAWARAVSEETAGEGPERGLLGMELVRLGLERGATARAALDVITSLLEEHGQWGSALAGTGHAEGAYDNSFLIADPREAWVLETVGREWAARQVTRGTRSISNELTIRRDADLTSAGLVTLAHENQWWSVADGELDVADAFTDPQTPLQVSHVRRRRSQTMLDEAAAGAGVDLTTMKSVLRDHLEGTFLGGPTFDAARPDFHTLCMHEHPSGFTWGNTAASLVVELHDDPTRPLVVWWSPVTPCTGVYLPVFVEAEVPAATGVPVAPAEVDPLRHGPATYDPGSAWWQWQQLLDALKDPGARQFDARATSVRHTFDVLEERWARDLPTSTDPALLGSFAETCLHQAQHALRAHLSDLDVDLGTPVDGRWSAHRPA